MLLLNECFESILEHSQTFLGVLITLNVLCFFHDKKDSNNFIHRMLNIQKKRLKKKLKLLKDKADREYNDVLKSHEWVGISRLVNSAEYNKSVIRKACTLQFNYSLKFNTYSLDVSDIYDGMKKTLRLREQFLAPLFTFLFGLIVFMYDEIIPFNPNASNFISFSLYVLLILSASYWLVIWITFIFNTNYDGYKSSSIYQKPIDRCLGIFWGSTLKYLVCTSIYCFLITLIKYYGITQYCVIPAFLLPILIIGSLRIYFCDIKGHYSYMHAIGHLLGFTLYGILITFITTKIGFDTDIHFTSDLKSLRFWIITFSLFNGILLPFICPYFKFWFPYACKRIEMLKNHWQLKITHNKLKKDYAKLCVEAVNSKNNLSPLPADNSETQL